MVEQERLQKQAEANKEKAVTAYLAADEEVKQGQHLGSTKSSSDPTMEAIVETLTGCPSDGVVSVLLLHMSPLEATCSRTH